MPIWPAAKNAVKHSDIHREEQKLDHVSYTNSTGDPCITPCQF